MGWVGLGLVCFCWVGLGWVGLVGVGLGESEIESESVGESGQPNPTQPNLIQPNPTGLSLALGLGLGLVGLGWPGLSVDTLHTNFLHAGSKKLHNRPQTQNSFGCQNMDRISGPQEQI